MKRRGFFKFLGMVAVAPVAIAKAVEHAKPLKSLKSLDWSVNPIAEAAGHVKTEEEAVATFSYGNKIPLSMSIKFAELPEDVRLHICELMGVKS